MEIIWVVLGVIVLLVLSFIGIYNGLVTARNRYKNAFAQIDVQLKRRYDLIPNLVESTQGYLSHEKDTLHAVIAARNEAANAASAAGSNPGSPDAMKALGSAEGILGAAMGRFNVVMEAYPDLKANTTIAQMMEELTSTENRISFSRQAFNDSVMSYNIQREKFPNTVVAGMFGFGLANQLEIEFAEGGREAPKVSFS